MRSFVLCQVRILPYSTYITMMPFLWRVAPVRDSSILRSHSTVDHAESRCNRRRACESSFTISPATPWLSETGADVSSFALSVPYGHTVMVCKSYLPRRYLNVWSVVLMIMFSGFVYFLFRYSRFPIRELQPRSASSSYAQHVDFSFVRPHPGTVCVGRLL